MRIVQVANFVSPTSGGLRTTLRHLASGYAARGQETVQVVPGEEDADVDVGWGRRITLRSPALPGTGYRILTDLGRLCRVLDAAQPDVLEVHDRTTLRGLGGWARRRGIPSLVVSHERLDRWLAQWLSGPLPLEALADWSNGALARSFDAVVCTTDWAAEEFRRLGWCRPVVVPLGVDSRGFAPASQAAAVEPSDGSIGLVLVSRLSREKRPEVALAALRELLARGVPAVLTVAGDGPLAGRLRARSQDLPVEWLGFVPDRAHLATVMARADVALAPGPVETFGLAALEALACGTPVVAHAWSALPGVIGPDGGRSAPGTGVAFASAVQDLMSVPAPVRRAAARGRAEQFSWARTVRGFLDVHERALAGAA